MNSEANQEEEPKDKHANVRLLSRLLENRKLAWWMIGGSGIYFLLSLAGMKIYVCPIKETTGLLCPGCGLTGGAKALMRGDLATATHSNWFTLFLALFWIAVAVGLIIPDAASKRYIAWVRKSEEITKWPYFFAIAAIFYALTRNTFVR